MHKQQIKHGYLSTKGLIIDKWMKDYDESMTRIIVEYTTTKKINLDYIYK